MRDNPKGQQVMDKIGFELDETYREFFPEYYQSQLDEILFGKEWINPLYTMGQTMWTSGIFNKKCALACHTDPENVTGSLSAMIVLKKDMRGGNLILPHEGLEFSMDDGTILIFNGGETPHGVTPMFPLSPNAYRYSAVYYTLSRMQECLCLEKELERAHRLELQKLV